MSLIASPGNVCHLWAYFYYLALFVLHFGASLEFNDLEMKTSSGLKHLGKDRARPPQKRRLPTRPSNRPAVAQDESKDDESIEAFWSKTEQE